MHSSTHETGLSAAEIEDLPAFLRHLADLAAAQTLPLHRQPLAVESKLSDGYDPVTEADRACERALRAAIEAAFPDAGILGEEYGAAREGARDVWVLDPIDGTRAFVAGVPVWMALAGLRRDGRAVAGLAAQPFTGERFIGLAGGGAWVERCEEKRALATRKGVALRDAFAMTTAPELLSPAMREALEPSKHLRFGADAYAFCMLAAGQIDLAVECGVQPYDVTALIPIVEAAGGVMTGADGGPAERGGDVVAAGSPELHAEVLDALTRRRG